MNRDLLVISHGLRAVFGQEHDPALVDERVLSLRFGELSAFQYMLDSLSPNSRKTYDSQTVAKQLRMLMATEAFYAINREVFGFTIPEVLQLENLDTIHRLLKSIVDTIRPYGDLDDLEERIDAFVTKKDQFYVKLLNIIERFKKRVFVEFHEFNIVGCPTSTDIDVVATVHRDQIDKEIDVEKLRAMVKALGYDTDGRELDVNLVAVTKEGDLEWSEKGGVDDTQNIIFETYRYHKQAFPCLVKRLTEVDIATKVNATAKFILDNMKVLIGKPNFAKERATRRLVYSSTTERLNYAITISDKIMYANTPVWRSAIKSLTMKIIQLMLLDRKERVVYTKKELAAELDRMCPGTMEFAIWLLFRGSQGRFSEDCLKLLIIQFKDIATRNRRDDLEWVKLTMDITMNPTELPDHVIREFVMSPSEPTDKFIEEFERLCPSRNTNNVFHIHCENTDLLSTEVLERHAVIVDQRSTDWLNLLTYYLCGKNTGVIPYDGPDWVSFYYNLIRGSIMELFAIKGCDFCSIVKEEYDKITLGFLVEDKHTKGSPAIAPDLLLRLKSGKIVPVEIKCIEGKMADNHHYRRAVSLASRQLETAVRILKSGCGIIVLIYVDNSDGKVSYDTWATMITINEK